MFRAQYLARSVVAQPISQKLLPAGGSRCCANNNLKAAAAHLFAQQRLVANSSRSFATTCSLREKQQPAEAAHSASSESTTTISSDPQPEEHQTTPKPKPKRRRRGYAYAAIFMLIGTSIGSLFRLSVSPPPLPEPGTKEDGYILESIYDQAKKLPLVQALSSDPAWESWYAYSDWREGSRPLSITSGPMSGCRGLAYQRIFHNKATGEMVSVVYFGGALSGFPGVVHGGSLATILDESMGRCAIYRFPARMGVTANLDLTYKKPTLTNAFYVVRTRPVLSEADEVIGKDGTKKSDRKLWVHGTVETPEGKVCVDAKSLFVVPKYIQPHGRTDGKW
ncbi:hypothetical protein PFICI_09862 [Pestalotiopsis fici W106-1]|uniref:Thioesterase domain-containing protein n=1 Tax=Pestalotiopsis fici (strain W106-1 / CGMCC3.15140) TaxID=1229662 RepID=W3WVC8_PESFW|nr:uncharacterized protein PFICI_09862 [Pestalotiopsis fici W106-1]ETS77800.1 hypothetical protein PFICI_09862 [Pestalotiopsis fici W106-1]